MLIQHALEVLPNETSIASFLCRSLSTIPGVKDVHVCLRGVVTPDDAMYRELCRACGENGASLATPPPIKLFPLRTSHQVYGALFLSIDNEDQFSLCQPYLANTANTVATLLESRDHVHQLNVANERIQRGRDELEVRVKQRTADLLRANEELQREMSERKVVEEKNQRLTQLYAALSQCNEAIVRCTREEELFPKICRSAVQFGGMKMAWIGLVDNVSQRVKPVACYGEGAEYLEGIQFSTDVNDPSGRGPTGTAIRENQPFWCQDFQRDPGSTPWHESSVRFGWGASAALPLERNGVAIGVFTLYADEANAFDEEARNLLIEMALDISYALDNFAREAARKHAEAALADAKKLLTNIIDTAPMRIFWKDKELRYLGGNTVFARDAGEADPADLLGKDDYQLGWKEQAELYRADDRRVMDTGIPKLSYDEPLVTPDGKTIWLRTSKVPLHDAANETIGVLGIYEDITDRKQAEVALQHSEDNLNRAQAVAHIGSWYLDISTNRLEWSAEAFRIFGIPRKEAVDLDTFISTIHPDDREMVLKTWNEALAGAPYDIEHRVMVDGETRWVRELAVIERDSDGRALSGIGTTQDITERKHYESQLEHQANYDELTGLANRNLFQDRLNQALAFSHRHDFGLAVLIIDLDHFKNINDSLGHDAGDALLIQVASRLTCGVREGDTVARQGGDEFVLLLPEIRAEGDVSVITQKLLKAISAPFNIDGRELHITCSIGIASHPKDGEDNQTLLKNADAAMYRAKDLGRNNAQYYAEEMNIKAMERLMLENSLYHALERNEFLLHYQPQVDLRTGEITGMEALVRWQHPELGLVSPARFIPVGEESGLIVPLGEWVLRTACAQNKAWQRAGLKPISVAVNLSARQFRQPNLVEVVAGILRETELDPAHLELELTESLVMQNVEVTIATLGRLKAMGIKLSIDDFGTGYSSLSYLKRFPIDALKIDQSFVRDITTDPDDAAIAKAIISMAHDLQLRVIAEGVETEEQKSFLQQRRCDDMQGFFFSKPVPAEDFEVLLRERICLQMEDTAAALGQRTLLLLDDEENILTSLTRLLRRDGYEILKATSAAAAFDLLAGHPVGVIISDQRMPEMNGTEFLRRVKQIYPDTVRMVLSGYTDLKSVTDAINEGAVYRFLTKPWDDDQLRANIQEAFQRYELAQDNQRLSDEMVSINEELNRAKLELEKRVERKTSEARYNVGVLQISQEMLEYLPVGVIGVGEDGLIAVANRKANELFGAGNKPPLVGCFALERLPAAMIECLAGAGERRTQRLENGCDVIFWSRSMGASSGSEGRVLVIVPNEESGD